jgi:hypothetical protein
MDKPKLLAFRVQSQPLGMEEISPYNIHPPHLDNFILSQKGQFELFEKANGKTLLRGTTWYHSKIEPFQYWKLWGDNIIHQIHDRVLNQIKMQAEKNK